MACQDQLGSVDPPVPGEKATRSKNHRKRRKGGWKKNQRAGAVTPLPLKHKPLFVCLFFLGFFRKKKMGQGISHHIPRPTIAADLQIVILRDQHPLHEARVLIILYMRYKKMSGLWSVKTTTGRGLDPRYTSAWQGFHAPPFLGEKSTGSKNHLERQRGEREKHQRPRGRDRCLN